MKLTYETKRDEVEMSFFEKLLQFLFIRSNGNLSTNDQNILRDAVRVEVWNNSQQTTQKVENQVPNTTEVSIDEAIGLNSREPTPLIGNAFFILTNIMLAGFSKVGKTFISIWLALEGFKKGLIKKACFFTLEDINEWQVPRYTEGLMGYNYHIFSFKMWTERLEKAKVKIQSDTTIRAMFYQNNRHIFQTLNIRENLLQKEGIFERIPFKLMVFMKILEEKINEGFDFFVLDSLSSVFDNLNNLPDYLIEELLKYSKQHRITFVVINHLSQKRTIYGKASGIKLFDAAYIVDKKESISSNDAVIIEVKSKDRYSTDDKFFIRRTRVNGNVAKHEIVDAAELTSILEIGAQGMKETALQFIKQGRTDGVRFDDLFIHLKEKWANTSENSVQNRLRELRREGLIEPIGKPWDQIRAT